MKTPPPQESNNDDKMDSLTVGGLTSETKLALESPFITAYMEPGLK